jgi:hypothetical protein
MPKRTRRLTAGVTGGLVLSTVLGIAPGDADVAHFPDRVGETRTSLDVWSVKVDNASWDRGKVVVAVQQDQLLNGDELRVYLDTRRRNAGPEYLLSAMWRSEYAIRRVPGWNWRKGDVISWRCANPSGNQRTDRWRVAFSRRCLGFPGQVRISVRIGAFVPGEGKVFDWAPGWRRLTPWVRR